MIYNKRNTKKKKLEERNTSIQERPEQREESNLPENYDRQCKADVRRREGIPITWCSKGKERVINQAAS